VVSARRVLALLRFRFDIVLAFVAPRAALVAENMSLRQQLIVVRRRVKRPRWRGFDRWLGGALIGPDRIWGQAGSSLANRFPYSNS
jgi:hypothetical protein